MDRSCLQSGSSNLNNSGGVLPLIGCPKPNNYAFTLDIWRPQMFRTSQPGTAQLSVKYKLDNLLKIYDTDTHTEGYHIAYTE
jgi:hypothetical protein